MSATRKMWIERLVALKNADASKLVGEVVVGILKGFFWLPKLAYDFFITQPFKHGSGFIEFFAKLVIVVTVFMFAVGMYASVWVQAAADEVDIRIASQKSACVTKRLKEKMEVATDPITRKVIIDLQKECKSTGGPDSTLTKQREQINRL